MMLVKGFGYFPKPLYDLVVDVVFAFVLGVYSPVLDIDVWHSVDKHLQFKGFENSQQIHGYDFIESFP